MILKQRVLFDLRNSYPFGWVSLKYFFEEVFQMFVSLQRGCIVVRMLDLFAKSEALITFLGKLLSKSIFFIAFEFEWIFVH